MLTTDAQEAAHGAIAVALEELQPDDAIRALIEMQALLLAGAGVEPDTPEFERLVTIGLTLLCRRTAAMNTVLSVPSAAVRH
jgi:hypothetical protein